MFLFQDEGFNFSSNGGNGGNGGDPEYRPIDAFIQGILEDQLFDNSNFVYYYYHYVATIYPVYF